MLVLLTASVLKAIALVQGAADAPASVARLGGVLLIMAELGLVTWLVSGWRRRLARGLAAVGFLGFTGVTMWKWSQGETSCGCFGPLAVHPAITGCIDLTLAIGLGWSRRTAGVSPASPARLPGRATRWILGLGTGLTAILGIVLLLHAPDQPFTPPQPSPTAHAQQSTDYPAEILTGHWRVVVFRSDCGHCQEIVPDLARESLDDLRRYLFIDATDPPVADGWFATLPRAATSIHLVRPDPWQATPQVYDLIDGRRRETEVTPDKGEEP